MVFFHHLSSTNFNFILLAFTCLHQKETLVVSLCLFFNRGVINTGELYYYWGGHVSFFGSQRNVQVKTRRVVSVVLRLDQCKWVNLGGVWWTCAFQLGDLHISTGENCKSQCKWAARESFQWKKHRGDLVEFCLCEYFPMKRKHMNFSGKFACEVRRNKTQGTDGLVFFLGDWVNWFTFYSKNSPKKERSERKRTNWHAWNACVGVECCEKGYTNGTHTTDSLAHWREKKQTPHL